LSGGDETRPDRLTQADYEALARLRYALRRFLAFSSSAAQSKGLPPQQHQALLAIKGSPGGRPMTVGLLAEQLLIAPHSATELVGRLVDAGLVTRETDPADRRRLVLSLTREAEDLLAALSAAHLREIREIAPALVEVLKSLEEPS
jgi:DNA-binding MarR family transcriptional regulator